MVAVVPDVVIAPICTPVNQPSITTVLWEEDLTFVDKILRLVINVMLVSDGINFFLSACSIHLSALSCIGYSVGRRLEIVGTKLLSKLKINTKYD